MLFQFTPAPRETGCGVGVECGRAVFVGAAFVGVGMMVGAGLQAESRMTINILNRNKGFIV